MPKSPESGPSVTKNRENVEQKIKKLFFAELGILPEEEKEEEYTGHLEGKPRQLAEYYENEKTQKEAIEKFKKGMEALLETIDGSWIDEKTLTVLENSRDDLGLDIPKIVNFLNDLKELKKKE